MDHACRMDHGRHAAHLRLGRSHRLAHILDIADIGLQDQNLAALILERLHGADTLHGRVIHARAQKRIPARARRQGGTGQQHHPLLPARNQGARDAQPDPAETAGDQRHAITAQRQLVRVNLGQRRGPELQREALFPPQRRHRIGRRGQQILQHARGQIVDPLALFPRRQADIQHRATHPRHLARDHPRRAHDGGFVGIAQRLAAHLCGVRGDDADMRHRVLLGHGLGQKQQAVETLLLRAVEKAAAGAETAVARNLPQMGYPLGHPPALHQIADQQVIARPPLLRGQQIAILARAGKGIGGAHGDNPLPGRAQPRGDGGTQPGIILEHQPVLRRQTGHVGNIHIAFRQTRHPCGTVSPAFQVVGTQRPQIPLGLRQGPLARFDEIAAALERIAGQRHTVARHPAPDLIPVDGNADSPHPRQHRHEIGVIRDGVLRMAQRSDHGIRRHGGMLPRQ